jgi:hypothetical protein
LKKPSVKTLIVLAAAAAGAAAMPLFASAAGASPDMTGKTFSEAQAALKMSGYTAVANAAIGDKTAQSDCKVIRQQDMNSGISGWSTSQTSANAQFVGGDQPTLYPITLPNVPTTGQVLLTLACYHASDAATGHPTGTGSITTKPSQ